MQGLPVKNKSSLSLVVHSRKADDTAADNAKGLPTDTATSHVEKRTGSVDGANAGGLSLDIAAMHLARGLEPLLVDDDIKVGAQGSAQINSPRDSCPYASRQFTSHSQILVTADTIIRLARTLGPASAHGGARGW